jgi:hypothetical protein
MGRSLATIGATVAILLLSGSAASAREEGGNPCVANSSEAGSTAIGLTNPPTPFEVPYLWSGVITRWKVPVAPGHGPLAQQLGVFEFAEGEAQYRKVAESATETVVAGTNEFTTRIPLAGEGHHYLGLTGPVETLVCTGLEQAVSGRVLGDFPLGAIRSVEDVGIGVPVTAISEPDLDQDGYGDETQDGCPRSAATQGGCPTVTPTAVARVEPGAILLDVRTDSEGLVKVTGETGWRLGPKGKGRAKASKRVGRRYSAALKATEEKSVPPGSVTTFEVPLPKSVKHHLAGMKPSLSLSARIAVTATDLAYRETSTTLTVKLHGRKRHKRALQHSHTRHLKH